MNKLKIFLSYHKNTPIYESDVFIPIQTGRDVNNEIAGMIGDNTGDNISYLNSYYCELTSHYWVLKNFLPKTDAEYIGFFHYRRLPDIENISEDDIPSIYGLNLSQSKMLLKNLSEQNFFKCCKDYDVILPCSVYMYKDTVNPERKENALNTYDQFKIGHDSDLLDVLRDVINEFYPEYNESLQMHYKSFTGHFFNSYIMKKNLMAEYLNWMFDVLDRIGDKIGGWENQKYLRMAGFVSECLTNIWIKYHKTLKKGFVPVYMVDFLFEYIKQANEYHNKSDFASEYEVLQELLKYSDEFGVITSLLELSLILNKSDDSEVYFNMALDKVIGSDDYNALGMICEKYNFKKNVIFELFKKSALMDTENKLFSQKFLNYCEANADISLVEEAWNLLNRFELDTSELQRYNSFKRCLELISKHK